MNALLRWMRDYFTSKNANILASTGVAFPFSCHLWQSFADRRISWNNYSAPGISKDSFLLGFLVLTFLICFSSLSLLWPFVFTFFFQSCKHQCGGFMVGLNSRYQGSETPAILSGGYFPNISLVNWRYIYLFFLQVHCWQMFQAGHSLQILLY